MGIFILYLLKLGLSFNTTDILKRKSSMWIKNYLD